MTPAKQPLAPPLTSDGYVGYLVRNTRTSGFKLAVVGLAVGDKYRVRFWRANTRQWTQPTLIEGQYLQTLTLDEKTKRRGLIEQASRAARELLGFEVWS